MTDYARNLWYMAAWEEEVAGDARLARTLLDEPWIIYRREDASGYAMLADRCPHRFAPLSRGTRSGDSVACPYHGLTFNMDGQCTHNPFSDIVPRSARVATCPAVARHGAIWFWPGDPDLADPASIPDFAILDDPKPMVRGKTLFNANYELITDNLMDLSHAEFLHVETFRTEGKIFAGAHAVREEGDAIWSNWSMTGTKPPPFLPGLAEGTRLDEWLDMRWHPPASMLLHIGFTLAGTPRDTTPFPGMVNPHIITPETQKSSHYFFTREPGEESRAMASKVFDEEDRPMLEAIQAAMGDTDFWDLDPVILNIDAAGIRARRRLVQMRRAEKALREQRTAPV